MINAITDSVRGVMVPIAKFLDRISKGKITPNSITGLSLIGHVPVFMAIIGENFILAAILLAFFGILDALDGALARFRVPQAPQGCYMMLHQTG